MPVAVAEGSGEGENGIIWLGLYPTALTVISSPQQPLKTYEWGNMRGNSGSPRCIRNDRNPPAAAW